MNKKTLLIILSYLTIYIVWGSTYFFIKRAVETIPSFYVVGLRFFVGGILILLFAIASGRLTKIPSLKEFISSIFLGTFLLLGGNGFVTVAENKVDSYIAALVLSATPLVVAIFDRILIGKKISLSGIIGIFIGIIGVGFLLYNGISLIHSLNLYILFIFLGLTSWGFATSLGHKIKVYPDVFVNSAIQMIFVGVISLFISIIFNFSPILLIKSASAVSLFSVLYLAVVGSLAFCSYNYLIANEPAIRVVSYAFVNPLIATMLGIILGNEKPVRFLLISIPLILTGLFLMLYGDRIIKRIKK